ncbi:MAG: ribosome recycling factor [Deltaproteobacteria bacterium]|nr:ribosome recycling factor [Deltaproteobacteria bacterium]
MSTKGVFDDARKKMDKAIEVFRHELVRLRTGRASVALLDGVKMDYYGTLTAISQVSTLSVPESRLIVIQPWDTSQITAIEKAIQTSGLGLTPTNDGKVVRIQVPQLTEERRKELVKLAKKYAEECRVAVRNCRRDANEAVKKLEKDKAISQDELKKAQAHIQEITDLEIKNTDALLSKKEGEIMEV